MSQFTHINCDCHRKSSSRNESFKFIEEEDLSQAMGQVRRQRANKKDYDIWSHYCASQIEKFLSPLPRQDQEHEIDFKHTDKFEENVIQAESEDTLFNNKEETEEPNYNIENKEEDDFADEYMTKASECVTKTNKQKSLGYSNITLVSSHRAECNNSERYIDPNEKLKSIRLRLKQILEVIASSLNTIRVPEDSVEMVQIQQKANEFCARFSRNHVYQVGRHLNEITKSLNYCLPYNQWKQYATQSKNIINLHQILFQAYSMFQRHMRIVWGFGHTHEKLHTLLQLTLEVNRLCISHQSPSDISCADLEHMCQKLIESLHELPDENNSSNSASLVDYRVFSPAVGERKVNSAGSRVNNSCQHDAPSQNVKLNIKNPISKRIESAGSGDRYSMYRSKVPNKMINQNKHWNPGPQDSKKNTARVQMNKSKGWLKTDHIFTPNKPLTYRKYVGTACREHCLSAHSNTPKQSTSAKYCKRPKEVVKTQNEMEIKITTKPSSIGDHDRDRTTESILYSKHGDSRIVCPPMDAMLPTRSNIDEQELADRLIPLIAKHFQKIQPEEQESYVKDLASSDKSNIEGTSC